MVGILAPIIGTALRQGARYVYRGLRAQDRIIDYTYRRSGLYNRGIVRGIKHGLAGGQIIGGTLKLGLPSELSNGIPPENGSKFTTRKFKKTYSRVQRYTRSRRKYCYPRYRRRR